MIGLAAFVLLIVRALANIVTYSLKLVSTVLVAAGAGVSQVVHVETADGYVSLAELAVDAWLDEGFPVPTPVFKGVEGPRTLGELVMQPVTWEVFAVHLLAAVAVVVVTMGLLESSWFLGLIGGLFTAGLVIWLDYWYVVYGQPYVSAGEFGTWTFAAAAGASLGLVGSVLVVEPVFDRERDESDRDVDRVLEDLEL